MQQGASGERRIVDRSAGVRLPTTCCLDGRTDLDLDRSPAGRRRPSTMEFTAPPTAAAAEDRAAAEAEAEHQQQQQAAAAVEKEHMFDKVVTPSDVGKLNRLVIPKQHAEKYFPLDAAANEKGLLLSFEDRTGKPWRFRYSYWNSSQSYVMTKGWSRFVKEKRLDAGDTVSFGRGVGEAARGRLFIDWRRRPDPPAALMHHHHHRLPAFPSVVPYAPWPHHNHHYPAAAAAAAAAGAARTTTTVLHLPPSPSSLYVDPHRRHAGYHDAYGAAAGTRQMLFYRPHQQHHQPSTLVLDSVPVRLPTTPPGQHAEPPPPGPVVASSASKRVRLFGVNLDCAADGSEVEDNNGNGGGGGWRTSAPPTTHQHGLPSPPSSSSSSSGKARCSLNLDL